MNCCVCVCVCVCMCHKRILMDYLFQIIYISSWVNHYSMFFCCLTQKKIYFLRMGCWPSIKTEHQRQKWTSDMESGIIYCFWLCSCLCHKRIWMDYLFQIHIFHPGSTTASH